MLLKNLNYPLILFAVHKLSKSQSDIILWTLEKHNIITSPTVHFIHIFLAFSLAPFMAILCFPSCHRHTGTYSKVEDQKGHITSREFSSNAGFDLCYFSVILTEPHVPRIPLALFRDTHDDSMEKQETRALNYEPIPNDTLSRIISILKETWKWGNDRYEAQHELPGRTLPSNTASSLHMHRRPKSTE